MRVSPLVLAAATASAFLVVPDVSEAEEAFSILPIDKLAMLDRKESFSIPCQKCSGKDAHLDLEFNILNGLVLVNGARLYPEPEGHFVADVKSGDAVVDSVNLGVALALVRPITYLFRDESQGVQAVDFYFTIREVDGVWMDDIPSVKMEMLHASDGILADVGRVSVVEAEREAGCDSLLCHAKEMLHETMKKFKGKGCRGRHRHHGRPMIISSEHEGQEEGYRPSHHRHHSHHSHHHDVDARLQRVGQVLQHLINYLFLPLFLGLVAGVGSAFIALIITSLIMKVVGFFRGRQEPSPLVIVEETIVDEKARLMMTEQDELPQYEDSPAYEQTDEKQ